MAETTHETKTGPMVDGTADQGEIYDRRTLTYANSFDDAWTSTAIRAIEWCTGKLTILRMVNKFEKKNEYYRGQRFWGGALKVMGIDLTTPQEQIAHIPERGPRGRGRKPSRMEWSTA